MQPGLWGSPAYAAGFVGQSSIWSQVCEAIHHMQPELGASPPYAARVLHFMQSGCEQVQQMLECLLIDMLVRLVKIKLIDLSVKLFG